VSRGMKIHNIAMLIDGLLFFVADAVSIAFCFIHLAAVGSSVDEVLAIVYAFFHGIIAFTLSTFVIRMLMKKKSMIMRTLMFYADDQKVPSFTAKMVCVVFAVLFSAIGAYSCVIFFNPSLGLFGSELPYSLRLVLINVSFFVVSVAAFFFVFPYLYERQEAKYD